MISLLKRSLSHSLLAVSFLSLIVLVIALPLLLTVPQQQQIYTPHAATNSIPSFSHVFVIIEENHDYSQIIGSSAAPYITQLSNQYGLASNFFAISHPSLPNYIAFTSGSTQGISTDCSPGTNCQSGAANIFSELEGSGKTWKAYQESMPTNCAKTDSGNYAVRHNPPAYYTNLKSCTTNDVPYSQFATDLASGNVGNFNFITPNLQDDMHNGTIQQGDTWLKNELPKILQSQAYQQNGLVVITFDEGQTNGTNQIPTILISPLGKQAFKSTIKYNLYSLLRTISDGLGVQPPGTAATSQDMSDFFGNGSSGGGTNPSTTPTNPPLTSPQSGSSPIKHVFIMMQENTDWSQIKGNSQAPYINSLLPQYAHAENYASPYHPSLPNYITLEAGANLGLTNGSAEPTTTNIMTTSHLTTLMKNAGVSWKYYAEDLPGNGANCNLTDPGAPYSEDHNPFVYFTDVSGNPPSAQNQYCIQHERPYSELSQDLQNNTVPQYSFIVPTDYDEGEKLAPGSSCKICQSDNFLKSEIPKIQASQAYQDGGVIFIIWDEGVSPTHNPSGMIVVSQYAKKGYQNTIPYSHASTVRTVEEIFGLSPFLNQAVTATDLSDFFTVPITGTGGGGGTNINDTITVCPHGLGNCGDNANPNGSGNASPQHTQRNATITFLNQNNQAAGTVRATLTYNSATQNFQGSVPLSNLANGSYLVTIKMEEYLSKQLPGIISLTGGQISTLPSVSLTSGDINNDNQLDILDYNLLIGCFGSKQNTSSCTTAPTQQSPGADLTDDGKVDGSDYNLFLRELSIQRG